MPPSHGESSGPIILAFHKNKFESQRGAAEQPSGGVACISFKSLISRLSAARVGPLVVAAEEAASLEEEEVEAMLSFLSDIKPTLFAILTKPVLVKKGCVFNHSF